MCMPLRERASRAAMFTQVRHCRHESHDVVIEVPEPEIAPVTQQLSDATCHVVMIHRKRTQCAVFLAANFWLEADGTQPALCFHHCVVLLSRQSTSSTKSWVPAGATGARPLHTARILILGDCVATLQAEQSLPLCAYARRHGRVGARDLRASRLEQSAPSHWDLDTPRSSQATRLDRSCVEPHHHSSDSGSRSQLVAASPCARRTSLEDGQRQGPVGSQLHTSKCVPWSYEDTTIMQTLMQLPRDR
jgi:hypothetical protein